MAAFFPRHYTALCLANFHSQQINKRNKSLLIPHPKHIPKDSQLCCVFYSQNCGWNSSKMWMRIVKGYIFPPLFIQKQTLPATKEEPYDPVTRGLARLALKRSWWFHPDIQGYIYIHICPVYNLAFHVLHEFSLILRADVSSQAHLSRSSVPPAVTVESFLRGIRLNVCMKCFGAGASSSTVLSTVILDHKSNKSAIYIYICLEQLQP